MLTTTHLIGFGAGGGADGTLVTVTCGTTTIGGKTYGNGYSNGGGGVTGWSPASFGAASPSTLHGATINTIITQGVDPAEGTQTSSFQINFEGNLTTAPPFSSLDIYNDAMVLQQILTRAAADTPGGTYDSDSDSTTWQWSGPVTGGMWPSDGIEPRFVRFYA